MIVATRPTDGTIRVIGTGSILDARKSADRIVTKGEHTGDAVRIPHGFTFPIIREDDAA
ncbi:hypothetical protein [Pseudolysinimonas sp.]|uniref:hypothetical protein n=1 Tax=Pseudolysinimonas sp. TaxID=2680009 RepID=UPI003F7CD8F6